MKDVTQGRHSEDQQVQRQEVEGAAEAIDYVRVFQAAQSLKDPSVEL